jgi:site-specific recombinase XerD
VRRQCLLSLPRHTFDRMRTRAAFPGFHDGRIPGNKDKTYPAEILTPEEVLAMLLACPDNLYGHRDRALITVMYRSGLRCAEALALQPKDVDLRVGSITVLHGKGDRRRTVGIDPGATEIVQAWIDRRQRDLAPPPGVVLFCSAKCRPLTNSAVRITLRRLASEADIAKRVHPHGFRHTMAYELMMEGVPVPYIQRQLGHTSLATTDRYLNHIAPLDVISRIRERDWRPG